MFSSTEPPVVTLADLAHSEVMVLHSESGVFKSDLRPSTLSENFTLVLDPGLFFLILKAADSRILKSDSRA